MRKNSVYDYDETHYKDEGAELVARIVANGLKTAIHCYRVPERRKFKQAGKEEKQEMR